MIMEIVISGSLSWDKDLSHSLQLSLSLGQKHLFDRDVF